MLDTVVSGVIIKYVELFGSAAAERPVFLVAKGDRRLRKLFHYAGRYRIYLFLAPVLIIGEVVMETFIPQLIAQLINMISKADETAIDMAELLKLGGLMVLMAFLSLGFGAGSARAASIGAMGFSRNLRHALFEKVQHFSFRNIDKFSTASLVTRLTTDVNQTQNTLMMLVRMAFRSPVMFVMAFYWAWRLNPSLITILLVAVPVLFIGLATITRLAYPRFRVLMTKYDSMNGAVQENLTGIRVVKAFVRETFEKSKFARSADALMDAQRRAEKIVILNAPLMQILMNGCVVAVLWFGGRQIAGGTMELGDLTAFITYITQILMSLMILSFLFVSFVMSRASVTRIREVLDEAPDIESPENARTEVADGSIVFEHVDFSYTGTEERAVLKDISVSIRSGETIGLIGATGSGKSSFISLIPRLYDVTSGRVLVGGADVREYDTAVLRDAVAVVLQKNVLFSGSITDNLRWGNENATEAEITAACQVAQADEFVRSFPKGYDTDLGQGGVNVSGGQKQRLCIARALLKSPKVMILDDATSAVDTATDARIREALRTQMPDTTKIIIAQRISSVRDADRIIVLDEGRITDVGTHEELMRRSEIYRDVYQSQQKGGDD